jgi:RNA-binding protein
LKPLIHVGKEGITDACVRSIEQSFSTRDLLKVKVLEAAPQSARDTGDALAARLDRVHVVQVIGRTVVLYRPEPEDRKRSGQQEEDGGRPGAGTR